MRLGKAQSENLRFRFVSALDFPYICVRIYRLDICHSPQGQPYGHHCAFPPPRQQPAGTARCGGTADGRVVLIVRPLLWDDGGWPYTERNP